MEKYLESHLEPAWQEDEKPKRMADLLAKYPVSVSRTFEPGIEYGEQGTEIVELRDGWTLEYSYEPVSAKDIEIHTKRYQYSGLIGSQMGGGRFRRLTSLIIKDENGEGKDVIKEFQVSDVFFASYTYGSGESYADAARGSVFSDLSPNSFNGIMTILHEIGHVVSSRSPKGRSFVTKKLSNLVYRAPLLAHALIPEKVVEKASENILKEERDAWSVAAGSLRRSLQAFGVSKEDFMDAVHKVALVTYSEKIRRIQRGFTLEDAKRLFF